MKALAPESAVRVLTAIDARNSSTGCRGAGGIHPPRPPQLAMNAAFTVPPRALAAARTGSSGTSRVSYALGQGTGGPQRERARSVAPQFGHDRAHGVGHRRRRAGCRPGRPAVRVPDGAARAGSGGSSRPGRGRQSNSGVAGCLQARPLSGSDGGTLRRDRGRSRGTGSDRRTPPSPSVTGGGHFWMMAARPVETFDDDELPQRSGPIERIGHDERGRDQRVRAASRVRAGPRAVGDRSRSNVGILHPRRRTDSPGCRLHASGAEGGPPDRRAPSFAAIDRRRAAHQHGDVAMVEERNGSVLQAPHEAFGVRHPVPVVAPHRAEANRRSPGDRRVLVLVQVRPLEQVDDPVDRRSSDVGVAFRPVHEPNEHGVVARDERRYAPHIV